MERNESRKQNQARPGLETHEQRDHFHRVLKEMEGKMRSETREKKRFCDVEKDARFEITRVPGTGKRRVPRGSTQPRDADSKDEKGDASRPDTERMAEREPASTPTVTRPAAPRRSEPTSVRRKRKLGAATGEDTAAGASPEPAAVGARP